MLLEHGANVNQANEFGETPFWAARKNGNIDLIRLFIDFKFSGNIPEDNSGITLIHRLARQADFPTLHLLLGAQPSNDVVTNPKAFFSETTLQSCISDTQISKLDQIPIEQFAEPITVVQNFCNTMIKMRDKSILILQNTDARSVYEDLCARSHQTPGRNTLTIYASPGHAFLRLKCTSCDSGISFDESFGKYPTGRPFYPNSLVNRMIEILPSERIKQRLRTVLVMFSEQEGSVNQETEYERRSFNENHLMLTLHLTDTKAADVFRFQRKVHDSCVASDEQSKKRCSYHLLRNRNCVSFADAGFREATGGQGHIGDYILPDQYPSLGEIFSQNQKDDGRLARLYDYKAILFMQAQRKFGPSFTDISDHPSKIGATIALGFVLAKIITSSMSWVYSFWHGSKTSSVAPASL